MAAEELDVVRLLAKKMRKRLAKVFALAYDYYEDRRKVNLKIEEFKEWRSSGKIPSDVEDYCMHKLKEKQLAKKARAHQE